MRKLLAGAAGLGVLGLGVLGLSATGALAAGWTDEASAGFQVQAGAFSLESSVGTALSFEPFAPGEVQGSHFTVGHDGSTVDGVLEARGVAVDYDGDAGDFAWGLYAGGTACADDPEEFARDNDPIASGDSLDAFDAGAVSQLPVLDSGGDPASHGHCLVLTASAGIDPDLEHELVLELTARSVSSTDDPDAPRPLTDYWTDSVSATVGLETCAAHGCPTDAGYFTFNASTGTITGYSSSGPKDVVIPRSINGVPVTSIGFRAFFGNQLTSVVIPDSVTSIGDSAFSDNWLTGVVIPDSVTSINGWAFADNGLTSVTIPDSVTSIGDGAFTSNSLTRVVIPGSVAILGSGAFADNWLTSVTIPDSVTTIRTSTFGSNRLTNVESPRVC
ncbi:leucine-rich repeat domain-containing protein [Sediminivirga luteola]|nr:leucine-rich repeat domain-containing protein [Sediminivirga luteola]